MNTTVRWIAALGPFALLGGMALGWATQPAQQPWSLLGKQGSSSLATATAAPPVPVAATATGPAPTSARPLPEVVVLRIPVTRLVPVTVLVTPAPQAPPTSAATSPPSRPPSTPRSTPSATPTPDVPTSDVPLPHPEG